MKTMIKQLGILALAVLAAVSCEVSGLEPEQPEGPVGKIHVKMGAKIQSTKSTVVTSGSDRTLNFSEGDRLYVRGLITGSSPQKIVAGYLSIDGVYDGTSVTFKGRGEGYNTVHHEVKITLRFWIVTILLAAFTMLTFKIR